MFPSLCDNILNFQSFVFQIIAITEEQITVGFFFNWVFGHWKLKHWIFAVFNWIFFEIIYSVTYIFIHIFKQQETFYFSIQTLIHIYDWMPFVVYLQCVWPDKYSSIPWCLQHNSHAKGRSIFPLNVLYLCVFFMFLPSEFPVILEDRVESR